MKVIIVGMGRVGMRLAEELSKEGHNLVAVDPNPIVLQECVNKYDIQGICGNGCVMDNLKEAGASHADMLIAVTPHDENNILCCMVGRVLGVKRLVARVRDPEYFDQFEFMHDKLGIGLLVNPEESLSHEILRNLRFPAAAKISSFARDKVNIAEFTLPEGNALDGLSLVELRKKLKGDFLVIAYKRDGETKIPNGETVLQAGDILTLCVKPSELRAFFKAFGLYKLKIQSVIILSGGMQSFYIARELEDNGFRVKIIEHDYETCVELKKELRFAQVVCGDCSDRDVLTREGIADTDAVICMSNYDENNILAALYAKSVGVKKTIPVLRGDSYHSMLPSIGLDSYISPYSLAASEVVRYLRTVDVREDCAVKALYKIAGEQAEGLLFDVTDDQRFVGKSLKELSLIKGVLIAAVVRGRTAHIPDGSFTLAENDNIIVIAMGKQILKLDDVIQP